MPKHLPRWPSPALVISLLALFIVLGGTSYAGSTVGAHATGLKYKNATLAGGWTYGGYSTNKPGFAKDSSGVVHLRGSLANGTNDTTAFTLPAGYRPPRDEYFTIYTFSGSQGSLEITRTGHVVPFGSDVSNYSSLDGVTYSSG